LPSATIGGGGLSGVGASGVGVMRRYRCLLIGARNKGQSKTYAKAPSVNASKFCNTFTRKADLSQTLRHVSSVPIPAHALQQISSTADHVRIAASAKSGPGQDETTPSTLPISTDVREK
jgi:hypothetical protein